MVVLSGLHCNRVVLCVDDWIFILDREYFLEFINFSSFQRFFGNIVSLNTF